MVTQDAFAQVHPVVQASYFGAILAFCTFCLHPAVLGIALIGGLSYGIILRGFRHMGRLLVTFILPGFVVVAIANPAFNHNGVTLLYTMDNGNSITLEAIVYGGILASGFAVAIVWFVAINAVMTRDRIVFLCGRLLPAMGLLLSLIFRFVPLLGQQFKRVRHAQAGIGQAMQQRGWRQKLRTALDQFSIMTTWGLEMAIATADSMKARGYGQHRRTHYARFVMTWQSWGLLALVLGLAAICLTASFFGQLRASYDPQIVISHGRWTTVGLVAFGLLCLLPTGMQAMRHWRHTHHSAEAVKPPYFA